MKVEVSTVQTYEHSWPIELEPDSFVAQMLRGAIVAVTVEYKDGRSYRYTKAL